MNWQNLGHEYLPTGSGVERSDGLHLTDITRDIYKTLYEEKSNNLFPKGLTMDMGFYWEDVFSRVFADRYSNGLTLRPGELVLDGIAMSPDGIYFSEGHVVLTEYKLTWASVRNNTPETNLLWQWQVLAYLKGIRQYYPTAKIVDFHIIYVAGDYRPPCPKYVGPWRGVATKEEIDKNWDMIVSHAKERGWL